MSEVAIELENIMRKRKYESNQKKKESTFSVLMNGLINTTLNQQVLAQDQIFKILKDLVNNRSISLIKKFFKNEF